MPSGTIVDLGCGDGAFTAAAARLTGRKAYAVDRRAGAVALARAAGRGLAVQGILGPGEQSGLPACSAAVVLCLRLRLAADGGAVVAEAARLLVTGGLLVLADWADVPMPAPGSLVLAPLPAPPDGWALGGGHTPPIGLATP